jgi:hypothetical protein
MAQWSVTKNGLVEIPDVKNMKSSIDIRVSHSFHRLISGPHYIQTTAFG